MSNKRTTMRKLREMLRLRLQAGLSIRAISRSAKLSVGGGREGVGPVQPIVFIEFMHQFCLLSPLKRPFLPAKSAR